MKLVLLLSSILLTSSTGLNLLNEPNVIKKSLFSGQTLSVYNCGEYLSFGEDATEDLLVKFEELYDVKVEYNEFDTLETMYNQLTLQPEGTYDLICPSEYMIQRLIREDLILPLDESRLTTYNQYCSPILKNKLETMTVEKDGETVSLSSYSAGYMWGTMGIVYDPLYVDEEDVKSWDVFWNKKYKNYASIKNSMRDTYVIGIMHAYKDELIDAREKFLNNEITSSEYNAIIQRIFDLHTPEDIALVKEELINLKDNIYGFEVDSGKNDMITGKIKMNLAWSGDAVYSIDEAREYGKELKYSVPEEGSNIWYDAWVMPKKANVDLAYEFINFLSEPYNAAMNMDYIGYTPFISGDEIFQFTADKYGASDFVLENTYYEDSIVYYENEFYQCINESNNNLPTNENYFEKLNEEDSPSTDPELVRDLSYYFDSNEQKSRIIYPFEDLANQLETQYPTMEIIQRCAFMNDFGESNNDVIIMWGQIKAHTNMLPYYIILITCILLIPIIFLIKFIGEKNAMKYALKRNEKK